MTHVDPNKLTREKIVHYFQTERSKVVNSEKHAPARSWLRNVAQATPTSSLQAMRVSYLRGQHDAGRLRGQDLHGHVARVRPRVDREKLLEADRGGPR